MKRIQIVAAMVAAGVVLATAAAAPAATLGTVGVYDSTSNSNSVDSEAPGNSSTLADFTTNVATAFAANGGGVIDFTTGWDGDPGPTTWTVTYGAGESKTFLLTSPNTTNQRGLQVRADDAWDTNEAISGTSYGVDLDGNVNKHPDHVFRLDFHTFSTSGEGIVELALTALSRDGYGGSGVTFTFKAFFDDATSATIVDVVTGGQSVDDTFFAFGAPTGKTIVALEATGTPNSELGHRLNIDDLAFITSAMSEPGLKIKKYFDTNEDGSFNGEDAYRSGWVFNVTDVPHGGTYNENHTTDANGEIYLPSLPAGTYTITETLKSDWTLTTGNSPVVVVIPSGGGHIEEFGNNLMGDANMDGLADTQDFTILKDRLGTAGGWTDADFNHDALVDTQDFTILKANLGHGAGGGVPTPEPASLSLLALGGVAVLKRRRKS
ncbi:MAG: PEP-CTERM sorting domain-containing protein [Planctomycetota bacterium]|jgi:hypothetical protein